MKHTKLCNYISYRFFSVIYFRVDYCFKNQCFILWYVKPSQQTFDHSWDRENRRMARRLMDRDKILKGKAKTVCKQNKRRNSFTATHQQAFSHFLGGRDWACIADSWEDKYHNHKHSFFFLLSLSFYCWACHMVWNVPLVSSGQPLFRFQPTCWGRGGRSKHCSTIAKTLVWSTMF